MIRPNRHALGTGSPEVCVESAFNIVTKLALDKVQSCGILTPIGPVRTRDALVRRREAELNVGEGRPSVQQPQCFGDHKAACSHLNEWHGD